MRTRLITFCSGVVLMACSSKPSTPAFPSASANGEPADVTRSSLARALNPNVSADDQKALTAGNIDFAFRLLQTLVQAKPQASQFFSPHSISLALAMTYAGAEGTTATEMATTLGFSLPSERLHPAWNQLDLALSSRGKGAKASDGKDFRLNIVNRVWAEKTLPLKTPFLDLLGQQYGAGVPKVDFLTASEPARVAINDWVAKQTENRIRDLLPPRSLSSSTRLVLTNAVYFNGAWAHPFAESATRPAPFTNVVGKVTQVPAMRLFANLPYAATDAGEFVEVPYDKEELSLVVFLPKKESGLLEAEKQLTGKTWLQATTALAPQKVALQLPKFRREGQTFSVKEALQAMGMKEAFDVEKANLKGMAEVARKNLFIDNVLHQAFVDVSEKGTEAAAATAVIVGAETMSVRPPTTIIPFIVDRPFLFGIRDRATGALIFLGRITELLTLLHP